MLLKLNLQALRLINPVRLPVSYSYIKIGQTGIHFF